MLIRKAKTSIKSVVRTPTPSRRLDSGFLCWKFQSEGRKWMFHEVSNAGCALSFYFCHWILTNFRSGKDRRRVSFLPLFKADVSRFPRSFSRYIPSDISLALHFSIFSRRTYNFGEMDRYGKMFIFGFQIDRNCISKLNASHRNIRECAYGEGIIFSNDYAAVRAIRVAACICDSSWETTRARVRLTLLLPPWFIIANVYRQEAAYNDSDVTGRI